MERKVPSNTPCDPTMSLVSRSTAERRSSVTESLCTGKSAALRVVLGPLPAAKRPSAPGLTVFLTRLSTPAWEWQLAQACTPSLPPCWAQNSALPGGPAGAGEDPPGTRSLSRRARGRPGLSSLDRDGDDDHATLARPHRNRVGRDGDAGDVERVVARAQVRHRAVADRGERGRNRGVDERRRGGDGELAALLAAHAA